MTQMRELAMGTASMKCVDLDGVYVGIVRKNHKILKKKKINQATDRGESGPPAVSGVDTDGEAS